MHAETAFILMSLELCLDVKLWHQLFNITGLGAHLVVHLCKDVIGGEWQCTVVIQQEAVAGTAAMLHHCLLHATQHLQQPRSMAG